MKYFWWAYMASLLLIDVNIVQWMLAIIVGGYGPVSGFRDAFEYFSIGGYFLLLGIRLVPYALVGILALFLRNRGPVARGIIWGSLGGVALFIAFGYWSAQLPYYTNEHVSSTTAIAFFFIPIYAVVAGAWAECWALSFLRHAHLDSLSRFSC